MLALLQQDLIREGIADLDGDRLATSAVGEDKGSQHHKPEVAMPEPESLGGAPGAEKSPDMVASGKTETQRAEGNPWLAWLRKAWRGRRVRRHLGWRFAAWISGGAALDEGVEDFWDRLGYFVVQGYGLTETAPIISVSNPFARRRGSVGRPLSGQEIRVGSDGELWVRGENVASGYLDDPEASAEMFRDGWLRTGDRVERDEKGRLYVRGRLKDVVVTADGTNVDPALVEKALEATPGVVEAACVGKPSPRGEEIHAVLVVTRSAETRASHLSVDAAGGQANESLDGQDATPHAAGPKKRGATQAAGDANEQSGVMGVPEDIEATAPSTETSSAPSLAAAAVRGANERLPAGQRVQSHTVWHEPSLPRTSLGKLKRAAIRERLARGRLTTDTAEPGSPADPVAEALARLTGREPGALDGEIDLDRNLGLSSLDRLDLMVKLEETTGRTLDEPAVAGARTLTDLRQAMERPPSTPIPMPRWARWRSVRIARSAGRTLLVAPLFHTLFRLRVEGREKIEGMRPPFLLVANHLSHLDTAAILFALPRHLRGHVAVAMATEHFSALFRNVPGRPKTQGHQAPDRQEGRSEWGGDEEQWRGSAEPSRHGGRPGQRLAYGAAVTLFHAYPLPRGGGFSGTLAYTAELVEAGYCPLIFPEGRLKRPDEAPPRFREGPAMLAIKLGLPVIPIGIDGSGERLPPGTRIPRPGTIHVRFGTPLQVPEMERQEEEAGEDDRVSRLTARLEQAVRALCNSTVSRTRE
jgi:long-chain acyl-CoA synthetase